MGFVSSLSFFSFASSRSIVSALLTKPNQLKSLLTYNLGPKRKVSLVRAKKKSDEGATGGLYANHAIRTPPAHPPRSAQNPRELSDEITNSTTVEGRLANSVSVIKNTRIEKTHVHAKEKQRIARDSPKRRRKKKAEIESRTSQTCARARVWFRRVHSGEVGFLYSRAIERDHFTRPQSYFVNCRRRTCKKKDPKKKTKGKKEGVLCLGFKKTGGDLAPEFQHNRRDPNAQYF